MHSYMPKIRIRSTLALVTLCLPALASAPNGSGTQLHGRWPIADADRSGFWRILPEGARSFVTGTLAHNIYTPRTAELATLPELEGDRPYSGSLTASIGLELAHRWAPLAFAGEGAAFSHAGVSLGAGTLGPGSFAGEPWPTKVLGAGRVARSAPLVGELSAGAVLRVWAIELS